MGNSVHTTRYSVLTFLPKNLFAQLHRGANLYFLAIVILNWVPQLNVFGKEISMVPLLIVLSATAIKDAYEDFRRGQADRQENSRTTRRLVGAPDRRGQGPRPLAAWVELAWADVRVGDVLQVAPQSKRGKEETNEVVKKLKKSQVRSDEAVPADLVILSTTRADGLCFMSSMNLDGETSLKVFSSPRAVWKEERNNERKKEVGKGKKQLLIKEVKRMAISMSMIILRRMN